MFCATDMAYNFKKKVHGSEVVDYGVPYDYSSIMHYPWTAFSKNGKKTLEPIRPLNGKTPYVKLSDDDALQARRMYKCSGKTVSKLNAGGRYIRKSSLGRFLLVE